MSAALLFHLNKEHSVHDDLQSVFWVFADMSHDNLPHDRSVRQLALSFVEYEEDPAESSTGGRGGTKKFGYLHRNNKVDFYGNSALSDLFEQFQDGIRDCEVWYELIRKKLTAPKLAAAVHSPPNGVPDHNHFLDLFTEALNRPSEDWSSERSNKHPLQKALQELQESQDNTLLLT